MNLDELKTAWNRLDENVLASQKFSEQMVLSMMKDRSKSTLANMQRELRRVAVFFSALLVLFAAIILGNPFDYTRWLEYVPVVLYSLLVVTALIIIFNEYCEFRAVSLTKSNLRESLRLVIQSYEGYQSTMENVWKLSLVAGFLFGVSLTARNFEAYGWTKSLLVVGGQAITVLLLYGVARWVFTRLPGTHALELRAHLQELDELEQA